MSYQEALDVASEWCEEHNCLSGEVSLVNETDFSVRVSSDDYS
ncbi:MAG: hypothetical protein ABI863_00585 [Ginsengibacter sp.]